jgi:hypothetical protein
MKVLAQFALGSGEDKMPSMIGRRLWFAAALLVICHASRINSAETPQYAWKAAAASAKITPQKPMWMAGYAARKKPSAVLW